MARDTRRRARSRGGAALIGFALAVAAGFAGTVLWLSVNADDTLADRAATAPGVTVQVAGTGPSAAAPSPAARAGDGVRVPVQRQPESQAAPASRPPTPPPAAQAPPPPQAPVALFPGLTPAPAPGLVEETAAGALPRIGPGGETPWQVYARPFDWSDFRPRIAVVVGGLGISARTTQAAIERLPEPVTLAFDPVAQQLGDWVRTARRDGHEVLLSVPMEPDGYPRIDPGPNTLLTVLPPEENRRRLEVALASVPGYVGVTTLSGSRFTESADTLRPVIDVLARRGLLLLDSRVADRSAATVVATQLNVPRAIVDRVIDEVPVGGLIDEQLASLERVARQQGVAVGLASVDHPIAVDRIVAWARGLEARGFVLAPVSAVVNRQPDR
jgi:polysaccharide deacetylase 2 family uncharacterized protein YibQ